MDLYTFPSSPFGTKVLSTAQACELIKDINIINYHPWLLSAELRSLNPLNKIPVLIDNDDIIYDSKVICEYIIEKSNNQKFFGANKISTLKTESLTDGILDAAVLMRYERYFRPKYLQSEDWYERQKMAVACGIEYIHDHLSKLLNYDLNFSNICVANMLAYIDLRFSDEPWRNNHESLFVWADKYFELHADIKKHKPINSDIPDGVQCIRA